MKQSGARILIDRLRDRRALRTAFRWSAVGIAVLVETWLLWGPVPGDFTKHLSVYVSSTASAVVIPITVIAVLADRYSRSRMLRQAVIWAALIAALAGQIWFLRVEIPDHFAKNNVARDIAVATCAVLLPLTMLAMFARLPIGRRYVKRRFVIRPFRTVKTKPDYDGGTVAALLYLEVCRWKLTSTAGRLTHATPEQATFNLMGTSVSLPLARILTQIRWIVTGQSDVVIDGVLEDSHDPPRIRAWVDGSSDMSVQLHVGTFGAELDKALGSLGRDILRALEPTLFAHVLWSRGYYERAVQLLESQEPTLETQIMLIELNVARGYAREALENLEILDASTRRIPKAFRIRLAIARAEALIKSGRYEDARRSLPRRTERALRRFLDRSTEGSQGLASLLTRLAESHSFCREYEAALAVYERAERAALREAAGLLRGGLDEPLDRIVERCDQAGLPAELPAVLWDLYAIYNQSARCHKLLGRDPLPRYEETRISLQALRSVGGQGHSVPLQEGVLWKAKAQHLWHVEPFRAVGFYRQSIQSYDECIGLCRSELESDDEDLAIRGDLAWSYCGKLACLHRLLSLEEPADTTEELRFAADVITRLVRPLGADSVQTLVTRSLQLAQLGSTDYTSRIAAAARKLLDGAGTGTDQDQIEFILEGFEESEAVARAAASAATEAGLTPEFIAAQVGLFQKAASSECLRRVYETLLRMLNLLVRSRGPDDVASLLHIANLRIDRDEVLSQCSAEFELLWLQEDKHHRAEAAYGVACVQSVLGNSDAVIGFLQTAVDLASSQGSRDGLIRAQLDEDFDEIRDQPAFRRYVYGETSEVAKAGFEMTSDSPAHDGASH